MVPEFIKLPMRGVRYSHIMPEVFEKRRTRTKEQVLAIREKYSQGETDYCSLADEYGVTRNCISAIITRKTWKHI